MKIPGTLRDDIADQMLIWRPIMAKQCTLVQVKAGDITLPDLQRLNAMMDMQSDISDQAIDDARRDNPTRNRK